MGGAMRPRVGERCLLVGGRQVPLYAAEFHYWRNRRCDWERILRRIAEAGFTVVTSFVLWSWHEYAPGRFDFTGETSDRRDLVSFVRLAGKCGLFVHLRPGVACCEWRRSGASSWGTDWRACFEALLPHLEDLTVSRGGPLLLVQVENEWFDLFLMYLIVRAQVAGYDGFHLGEPPYWMELCGPHPHYCGSGEDFSWEWFLEHFRRSYPSVEALSAAWGRRFASFEEFAGWVQRESKGTVAGLVSWMEEGYPRRALRRGRRTPFLDLSRWARLYMAYPLSRHVRLVRRYLDCIITHNWPSVDERLYNRLAGLDLSGYDLYQPTSAPIWEWLVMSGDLAENRLPFCGEFMCGTIERYMWGGQGFYTPDFARLSVLSYFASGLAGVNLYMFVERDNWLQCPVDDRGGVRESYVALSQVFGALRRLEWHRARRLWDVLLVRQEAHEHFSSATNEGFARRGLDMPWIREELYDGRDPKREFHALTVALHERGLDFSVANAVPTLASGYEDKVIVSQAFSFMNREFAHQLLALARRGGRVLLLGTVPAVDEKGRALRAFTDLGLRGGGRLCAREVICEGRTFALPEGTCAERLSARGALRRLRAGPSGATVGALLRVGKGLLAVLGVVPPPRALLAEVLEGWFGARRYAWTGAPESDASLFLLPDGGRALILYNGAERELLGVRFDAGGRSGPLILVDELTGERWPARAARGVASCKALVPARDARLFTVHEGAVPPRADSARRVEAVSGWRLLRQVGAEDLRRLYAAAPGARAPRGAPRVRVPLSEWTLPAIASGRVFGVQGFFWLHADLRIPRDPGRVLLSAQARGWHNLLIFHVNGVEVGRLAVERPAPRFIADVTDLVRPGANRVSVRVLRQSLDCNDLGGSGLDELALEWAGGAGGGGPGRVRAESALLLQERPEVEEGFVLRGKGRVGRVELPLARTLLRNTESLWLEGTFASSGGEGVLVLEGEDCRVTAFLNGEYLGSSPHMPARIPGARLRPGRNRLVLRLAPDPHDTYTVPRAERYRRFVCDATSPVPVRLARVCFELDG